MNNFLPGNTAPVPAPHPAEQNGHHPLVPAAPPAPAAATAPPPPRVTVWRVLALPLLLAFTCGLSAWVVTSFFMTRWYESGATLYFPAASGGGNSGLLQQITGTQGGDPALSQDGGLYSTPLVGTSTAMAMSVLTTGRVQGKVMAQLHLDKQWHLPGDKASQRLSKSVSYGVDRNGFLAIQARDTDPATTVRIVNAYVDAMQQVSTELTTLLARRNRKALQARLDSLNERLLTEQNELAKLQMQASRTTPLGTGAQTAYQALDAQRQTTEFDLRQAKALLAARLHTAQATAGNATNLPAQLPYAQQAHQRLLDLQNQFAATKATYGPDYPQYQQQQAELAQAQADYEQEVKRETLAVQKGITPDVAQLMANVQGLQTKLDGIHQAAAPLRSDLQSLPLDQMRQTRLTSRIAIDGDQVKAMTLDVERAQEVEDRNAPAFEVIDGAGVPGMPILPRVWFTTAFATVAGFLLALAWRVGAGVVRHASTHDTLTLIAEKYKMIEPVGNAPGMLQTPDRRQVLEQRSAESPPNAQRELGSTFPSQPEDHE